MKRRGRDPHTHTQHNTLTLTACTMERDPQLSLEVGSNVAVEQFGDSYAITQADALRSASKRTQLPLRDAKNVCV